MSKNFLTWPFVEAHKILERTQKKSIVLSTGYGPSGLPHIGTFGEVLRTTAVMKAIRYIEPSIEVKLLAFSDDMDGLRKVPDNIPSKDFIKTQLGKPLTSILDPFETHKSYGAHMNAKLQTFLDAFNFEYTFISATECYKSGLFNNLLSKVLQNYEAICDIMLPSLGKERQKTYSPFLPLCHDTGRILEAKVIKTNIEKNTITYINDNGQEVEQSILDGNCKLQWKPDWGMRWVAFDVDFEAHGKDLRPSAELSAQICSILGRKSPTLFPYELFLDAEGKKISKSKGNGLSIDEWLEYGPKEGLSYYILKNPKSAKKLSFDVIPKMTDEYMQSCKNISTNPDSLAWFVHKTETQTTTQDLPSFSLLLNLASACNPENESVMRGFIEAQLPALKNSQNIFLDKLIYGAIRYYNIHVKPKKTYRIPSKQEKIFIQNLSSALNKVEDQASANEIQTIVFEEGKNNGFSDNMKDWFRFLYETLFGQKAGPKIGSFVALYGFNNFQNMLKNTMQNE